MQLSQPGPHDGRAFANLVIFEVGGGKKVYAYTQELSEDGFFVKTKKTLEPGTVQIQMLLDLGGRVECVEATAAVAACSIQGTRVRIVSMDESGTEYLRSALRRFDSRHGSK